MRRWRAARWPLLAVLLHAAVFVLASRVSPRSASTGENAPPTESQEIELMTAAPVTTGTTRDTVPAPSETPRRVSGRSSTSTSPAASGTVDEAPSPPSGPWTLPTTPESTPLSSLVDDVVLGRRNVFLGTSLTHVDAPPAETLPAPLTAAEQSKRDSAHVTASLRDGLAAGDAAKGLGPDGPVVGAARDVVRTSAAPVDSRVVFAVTADETGEVTDVRVASASPSWSGWGDVAKDVKARLAGRKLRLHDGTHGIDMSVEVTSADVLPDGATAAFGGPGLGFIPPDGAALPSGIPPAAAAVGFGVHFEPCDVGVHKTRAVHAHVVAEHYRS
jgi:hypothetical protein